MKINVTFFRKVGVFYPSAVPPIPKYCIYSKTQQPESKLFVYTSYSRLPHQQRLEVMSTQKKHPVFQKVALTI
jgi:hypothetical protein